MNIIFIIFLIFLLIITFKFSGKFLSVSFYLILGYFISILFTINYSFSIEYMIYLLGTFIVSLLVEMILSSKIKYKNIIRKPLNKVYLILFFISLLSYLYMLSIFIRRYGIISPLRYSYLYEDHLYISGITLLYRSAIPLYVYSIYKILIEEKKEKIYKVVLLFTIITLFIKFNKADMYILIVNLLVTYILKLKLNKKLNIKKIFILLSILGIISVSYFYIFNFFIFNDYRDIVKKFNIYLSYGQIYLDKIISNKIILNRKSINLINIFLGRHEGIPEYQINSIFTTNVVSFLGEIYLDFSYIGIIVVPLLLLLFYFLDFIFNRRNYIMRIFIISFMFFSFFSGFIYLTTFWLYYFYLLLILIGERIGKNSNM